MITLGASMFQIICLTSDVSGLEGYAYLMGLFATLLTNVAVTGLIGYRAWQHYRSSSEVRFRVYRDRSLAILLLLVESGALYCAVWVVGIVIGITLGTTYTAELCLEIDITPCFGSLNGASIFTALLPHLTGMYPTVIIALCKLQASYSATVMDLRDDKPPPPGLAPNAPSPSHRQPVRLQSASLRTDDGAEFLAEESSSTLERGSVYSVVDIRADKEQIEPRPPHELMALP
ncbi:hypothetical protein FA95DRAFT_774785 [Auriscalpium vulgare]|uniref:Uncharacterized protein n=1 Tax=Auriscalpium vulgare TaxID=40419 RepID=A0ACB8S1U3_9AGAM|nr:hypothetical protein FA95DRAFT_774785 [Auriscalpium vulgare]